MLAYAVNAEQMRHGGTLAIYVGKIAACFGDIRRDVPWSERLTTTR